ncbi:24986_t:CDS:2, partial [Gigaspora rosea]
SRHQRKKEVRITPHAVSHNITIRGKMLHHRFEGTVQELPLPSKDVLNRDLQHGQSILQRTAAKTGSESSKESRQGIGVPRSKDHLRIASNSDSPLEFKNTQTDKFN